MSATSTDRVKRARLYRKAALMVEDSGGFLSGAAEAFCCNAVFKAAKGDWVREDRDTHPLVVKFHEIYKPEGYRDGDAYFAECDEARVIALCFMAAMVEAGDA